MTLRQGRPTDNEFLEDVDVIVTDHCSIETNDVGMFQLTPHLQLVRVKIQNVYLTNRQKLPFPNFGKMLVSITAYFLHNDWVKMHGLQSEGCKT